MDDKTRQFLTAPIGRLILAYSAPAIAGLLVYGLNRVVGNIFVGRLLGTQALAGFSVAYTLVTVVLAFVVLVGAGATVAISIELGKKNPSSAQEVLGTSVVLSLGFAVPLGFLVWFFRIPLLAFCGAQGEALVFGERFLSTFLLGVFFQFLTNVFNSALRAVGKPYIALATNVLSFVANTVLTAVFLLVVPLGIEGVGLANTVSQGLMALWTASFFVGPQALVRLDWRKIRWNGNYARAVVKNGAAPFSLQILMAAFSVITNILAATYAGNQGMAVMGVVFSLYFVLVMPLQGTGTGIQPILGFNFGAQRPDRVHQTVVWAMIFTSVVCCFEWSVVMGFPQALVSLFVHDEPTTLALGSQCLVATVALFPLAGISVVLTAYFQSLGQVRQAVGLTVFRSLFNLLPLVVFPVLWGFSGIFWSYPATEFVVASASLILFRRTTRRGGR